MKFLIFLVIVAIAVFYVGGKINDANEPLVTYFVTWTTTLIVLNLLIGFFLYQFTHSIKSAKGNQGLKGRLGRRGPEGDPEYADFSCD